MSYYHVIAKVESDEAERVLFSDLRKKELASKFINPYEKGANFFSENVRLSPYNLQQVKIFQTEKTFVAELDEIKCRRQEKLDQRNNSDSGVVFLSLENECQPMDIAEAGEDLTQTLIKGHPGFKADKWKWIGVLFKWFAGILAMVLTGLIVNFFGRD